MFFLHHIICFTIFQMVEIPEAEQKDQSSIGDGTNAKDVSDRSDINVGNKVVQVRNRMK